MEIDVLVKAQEKMNKSIEVLKRELSSLRAGRANPQVLDRILVDYYGAQTPISQLANISVPEPRMLAISLWDPSTLGLVEKAILASDLGINPSNDGKVIRLVFPELTEERRRDLTKQVKKFGEDCKVAIRSVRRDAMDGLSKQEKDNLMTEDDRKQAEKEVQKLTDNSIKTVDEVISAKESEIMSV